MNLHRTLTAHNADMRALKAEQLGNVIDYISRPAYRGQQRAREIARGCGSDFAERRAMLTASFIVRERFPMLRPSFQWADGPVGFAIDLERRRLRDQIQRNFCERLTAKYRRMMPHTPFSGDILRSVEL